MGGGGGGGYELHVCGDGTKCQSILRETNHQMNYNKNDFLKKKKEIKSSETSATYSGTERLVGLQVRYV